MHSSSHSERKWDTHKQQLADNGPTQAQLDHQHDQLKSNLCDAANELGTAMGCAAFYIPGRHENGMFVAVGTREQIVEMLKGAP